MAEKLKLGVRELVEFCCRSGDLGYDDGPGIKALEGLQTHQKIQRRYRNLAEAEVALKWSRMIDDCEIELGGRIDLLFADESPPRIEEIKTVHAHGVDDDADAHYRAQLKCYGCGYAQQQGLDAVNLSLNRVNLFSREEHRHSQVYTRAELEHFVDEVLRQYLRWYRLLTAQRLRLGEQARDMTFPFDQFRAQQRYFAAEVYRAIVKQQRLMVEAPTGSGKTVSTLFPALKAIGEDECDQIVYLSAKVSGQQQAVETLEMMQVDLSYAVIQAKARCCPCNFDEGEIDADGRCLRCVGFFERLQPAREKLLQLRRLDVSTVQSVAAKFSLCPFELTLQMLPWVEVIICDFNYVFDPLVQLTYFRGDQRRKLLLIDELHNLVDRARGMYSANLSRRQIKTALAADNSRTIDAALKAMQQALDRELRKQEADKSVAETAPTGLLHASQRFGEKLGFDIFNNKHIARETLDFSKEVFRFQSIGHLFSRHHRALGMKPLKRREMRLRCLNAFEYLQQCYPLFQTVCGFSATLSPPAYFLQALGLEQGCKSLSLESSFPGVNLAVRVCDYVDTRYRQREFHIDRICDSIAACYRARPGNYLVFFSAYQFMQQVHERFLASYPEIETLLQQRDFDEAEQRRFLSAFFESDRRLGFAIMGGRFAEGIDYRGKALIGAIIVGVGLPQANLEQQLIQQDFESLELDGFDYAFRFPGLIRVMQSAGRVIRSETDRGVVVLLDRRFRQTGYARCLPRHWQTRYCNSPDSLEQSLTAFWEDREEIDAED
ncbi:MAG: ATP-dependent DNA helicase [Gammaproteobacteria bacterium]|nr:MAG: ATP-dependent DNA helicase [Gammaproteobacteria bacterium]